MVITLMRSSLASTRTVSYTHLDQGDGSVAAGKAILAEQRRQLRARMADMQASLDHFDRKIERCEQLLLPIEQELAEKQGGKET